VVATLSLGGVTVAEYVTEPDVDPRRGPRPYLHPVRTLRGTVVSDVLPEDHPHHLGVSVALQDVNGVNLWGGRTYVRGQGYTWLDDHGRIEHVEWIKQAPDRLANRLAWRAADGSVLLEEHRDMAAVPAQDGWVLDVSYTLTNPTAGPISLGSPGTNGRPGKAGYGGFFWRAAPGSPTVSNPDSTVEEEVNGSRAPWVALVGDGYTLVFEGLGPGDHWFVRASEYPGVCVALAFEHPRVLQPGQSLSRRHRIGVYDGARTVDELRAENAGRGTSAGIPS
jgi:hypothetical protein